MNEDFDILNENGELTGKIASKDATHKEGLLHRSVHIWIVNHQNQILLQKRSPEMYTFPNMWDISAGGHITAGNTSRQAAVKEVSEEIGLNVPETALTHLFTNRSHTVLRDGTCIEDEFQDVYLVRLEMGKHDLVLQKDEVTSTQWMDLETLKEWVAGKGEPMVPHIEEYQRIITYLELGSRLG